MNFQREIYKMGEIYRSSESEQAKKNYDKVIRSLILQRPEEEHSDLEKMWEFEIE